jgi:hypothetical protein
MAFQINVPKNPSEAKRAAIEAAKIRTSSKPEDTAIMRYISPGECIERNRIVFDDSSSMRQDFDNAKKGVVEFLRNCIPNQTSVAVHFMNESTWNNALRSDLPQLSIDIQELQLKSGGTPFFNTLRKALEAKPTLTRLIAFTDGAPTDSLKAEDSPELQLNYGTDIDRWRISADIIIKIAHSIGDQSLSNSFVSKVSGKNGPCIPIDTVYFGEGGEYEHRQMHLLQYLSEQTGGFFLHFDPAKIDFKKAFKYLAPVFRLQLSNGEFRKEVESGRR